MVQFDVELSCIATNVACKVQRYIHLLVVEGVSPKGTYVAGTNKKDFL